ncbi:hypothetical protein [Embleya sp. NPDC005575]|uniref:hypothetical protein n=1 Tax=Embleya sp. NPDC005575 TaxID=3156892 RepID=UPI0033A0C1B7
MRSKFVHPASIFDPQTRRGSNFMILENFFSQPTPSPGDRNPSKSARPRTELPCFEHIFSFIPAEAVKTGPPSKSKTNDLEP